MASIPQTPPTLKPTDAESIPTWRAAYSDRTAALMAAFSQLAYVPFVDPPADGAKSARPKAEPAPDAPPRHKVKADGEADLKALVAPGGFEVKALFDWDDVQAFLAVNAQQMAVLAFRGTANAGDWEINLNALTMPMPGFPTVRVHRGFWDAFAAQRDEIKAAVDQYVPPTLGLYITGHSLGGALAQIASAVLERDNLAACYTFGSPRVASMRFDLDVKCPNYRLINHWDLVPGVPLPVIAGYYHAGDPRLLAGHEPKAVLRRDRWPPAWFLAQLKAIAGWIVTHALFDIDDHMIWNYRRELDAIAKARNTPPTEATPPPQTAPE